MPLVFALVLTFLTFQLRHPFAPSSQSNASPTSPPSLTPSLSIIKPTPKPISAPQDDDPWGVAQKVGEHTYKIKVQNDSQMGTPDEILSALNALRARHGAQNLSKDPKLCEYAQYRAETFNQMGGTDEHKGFSDFLEHQDGFNKLGYGSVGENSSYGYVMSGVHLIEFVYMQSPQHNSNQLNPDWDHGCVGVVGVATNLIFSTSPL